MSVWNFCLFKTIFGKSMFTGGKNTSTHPLITSTHLLLISVEKAVSRKISFGSKPNCSNILLRLATAPHLVQQVVIAREALLIKTGLTGWMWFERIPGRRRAGWTRGPLGPEEELLQSESWVEVPQRPPWKKTQGSGPSLCREHPWGYRFIWLDLNVWDIEKLTQRWEQQQMEFWGRPSQNHLSLHSSQKDCYHSVFWPGDKSTTSHLWSRK